MTDYYSILGVNKGASSSDIKKGYFKQSKLYHPDKNKNPNAKEQFQKINEAYEVLQDPEKKKIYDQFGKEGLETMGGGGPSMGHPFEHVFNFGPGGPGKEVLKFQVLDLYNSEIKEDKDNLNRLMLMHIYQLL